MNFFITDQNYYNPKMSWTEYHSLETIYEFLNDLEREFPNLIKIVEIGKTYEGKRMLMAKIGRNIQRDFSHKHRPAVFIEGGIKPFAFSNNSFKNPIHG